MFRFGRIETGASVASLDNPRMPPPAATLRRPIEALVVYGTRPEAIKLAPVVAALRRRSDRFRVRVCATGQHREMLAQTQRALGLVPDVELALMQPGQGLNRLLARIVTAVDQLLSASPPRWLVVQGDTTTALGAALAAFHRGVPVAHVEAGLRTGDLRRPFPEELNRRIVDMAAAALFAPTPTARQRLLDEGCDPARVHLVGNTVIDALRTLPQAPRNPAPRDVLVTVHRRESMGEPLGEIVAAVQRLATDFPALTWVIPTHPNPRLRPALDSLAEVPNVELVAPFDHPALVACLRRSLLVLTDSGGLQEEAAALGIPVLVLREETERPEGIAAGVARLVGRSAGRIVAETARLLGSPEALSEMARPVAVYGDGRAAERIVRVLAGEPWEALADAASAPPASRRDEAAAACA